MTINPLGDRVLIRPQKNPERTESGLHLAEHRKPETAGTILSVGERVRECRPGQFAMFSWQSGQECYINDERLLMMREDDVLAVIDCEEVHA